MTERTLQKKCIDYARDNGILAYKFASPAQRGVPDVLFILPGGLTIYVEFKNPNGKGRLSKLQELTLKRFKNQGATAYVCQDYNHFCEIIAEHTQ